MVVVRERYLIKMTTRSESVIASGICQCKSTLVCVFQNPITYRLAMDRAAFHNGYSEVPTRERRLRKFVKKCLGLFACFFRIRMYQTMYMVKFVQIPTTVQY